MYSLGISQEISLELLETFQRSATPWMVKKADVYLSTECIYIGHF